MEKVFLSFLGTNKYLPCNYYLNNNEYAENVNFVQEAMVKIFYKKYEKLDKVIIFLTKKARQINWEPETKEPGLKGCLKDLNLPFKLIDVEIPEGKSSEEIWKIFEIVYNSLQDEDNVILDITHGFRSLPMLGIVLLNYARFLKRIKVLGIYYGAFEVLGTKDEIEKLPINERNAPIFDLTNFEKLQRWSIAAENFVDYGRTEKIQELISEDISDEVWSETIIDPRIKYAKNLSNELNNISQFFYTVRGKRIINGKLFEKQIENLKRLKGVKYLKTPFNNIRERIIEKIIRFKRNKVINGFFAIEWCIDHGLIQQGITLLREMIITLVLQNVNNKIFDKYYRELVAKIFRSNEKNMNEELIKNIDFVNKVKKLKYFEVLRNFYQCIGKYRNDINHGGFIEDIDPDEFRNFLESVYKQIKRIFLKDVS